MRGTEYLILVVMIGVFVWLIVSGANTLNQAYPNMNQINTTNLTGNYDQIAKIQDTANKSYQNFQTLGAEDKSWFQKIGAGIVAIPYAVVNFPIMVVVAITALVSMLTVSLGGWVPTTIILAIVTFITIAVVREFMSFFQRARS